MAKTTKPPKKRKVNGQWVEEKVTHVIELVPTTPPTYSAKQKKAQDARKADTKKIKEAYDADSNWTMKKGVRVPIVTYQDMQKWYYKKKK